jgi:hypothetical protein
MLIHHYILVVMISFRETTPQWPLLEHGGGVSTR